MHIDAREDTDQRVVGNRPNLAECPNCGQKLFQIESLATKGAFRIKCRRCKRYIKISAIESGS